MFFSVNTDNPSFKICHNSVTYTCLDADYSSVCCFVITKKVQEIPREHLFLFLYATMGVVLSFEYNGRLERFWLSETLDQSGFSQVERQIRAVLTEWKGRLECVSRVIVKLMNFSASLKETRPCKTNLGYCYTKEIQVESTTTEVVQQNQSQLVPQDCFTYLLHYSLMKHYIARAM